MIIPVVEKFVADAGAPVLNVMFHSSEAIAGGSPYNTTRADEDAFLDRRASFLRFAVRELGARPATLREFQRVWCGANRGGAEAPAAR